jgi:anaerobic ribonucleoside-triphosphate reductase activating protein
MNYAQIRSMDISNGEGIGVSLFVQGCDFHCKNCFNSETWEFSKGQEWNDKTKNQFLKLIETPFIQRVSILGGEPLHPKNVQNVLKIVDEIRVSYPAKNIWLYTGYTWEQIMHPVITDINSEQLKMLQMRKELASKCDVLIDGRYIDELRDVSLHWRGSSNQRVINVQETLKQKQIVLWES